MAKNKMPLNPAEGLFSQSETQKVRKVHDVQDEQVVQEAFDTQEEQQAHSYRLKRTQGRKGHKLPRINMAFTPENHVFITRTSRQQGISATEFVNNLIDKARCNK